MVCNSCENSYNVLSHSHICQGCGGGRGVHGISRGGGGGVVKKRESPDFRSPDVGISVYASNIMNYYYQPKLGNTLQQRAQKCDRF